ncbi:hypothetical protein SAMN02990966_07760 [Rhodospirillales bacterium URHD0017]|nr:hypothetical protein SAMN02990966_07760 [Rhodospirillales bacterium URHD0017]
MSLTTTRLASFALVRRGPTLLGAKREDIRGQADLFAAQC